MCSFNCLFFKKLPCKFPCNICPWRMKGCMGCVYSGERRRHPKKCRDDKPGRFKRPYIIEDGRKKYL